MARDFDGVTDRIDYTNSIDWSTTPLTCAFWCYPETLGSPQMFASLAPVGEATSGIEVNNVNTARIGMWIPRSTSALFREAANSTVVASTWQHFVVTWDGGTAQTGIKIYKNGSEVGSYANGSDGSGTLTAAGGMVSLGAHKYRDLDTWDGRMAEFGLWNRVLSAGEIAALAKKYCPSFFLSGLKIYAPLVRDPYNLMSGDAGTLDGTTVVVHPPVIRPVGAVFASLTPNLSPVNTVPKSGAVFLRNASATAVTGISVASGASQITSVTVSADNSAILTMTASGAAVLTGNGSSSVVIDTTTSDTDFNNTLASLTVQGSGSFHGKVTITVLSSDGTLSDSDNFYELCEPRSVKITFSGTYAQGVAVVESIQAMLDPGETAGVIQMITTDTLANSDSDNIDVHLQLPSYHFRMPAGVQTGVLEGVL